MAEHLSFRDGSHATEVSVFDVPHGAQSWRWVRRARFRVALFAEGVRSELIAPTVHAMTFSCDTGARLLAMHVGEPYNRVLVYHWRSGKLLCDDDAPPGVRGHRLAFNPSDASQLTLSWTAPERAAAASASSTTAAGPPESDATALNPNKLAHGGSSGMRVTQRRSSVLFAEQEAAAAAVAAGVVGGLRMWRVQEGVEASLRRYPPFQGLGERCDVTDYHWLPDNRLIVLLERARVAVVTDGVVRQEIFPAAGLPGGTDMSDPDAPYLLSVAMHGLGFAVGASDGSLLVYMPESITRARKSTDQGGGDVDAAAAAADSWFRIARRVVVHSPFRETGDKRSTPVLRLSPSPGTDVLCLVTGVPPRRQSPSPSPSPSAVTMASLPEQPMGRDRPEGTARLRCIGLWDVEQAVRADADDEGASTEVGPMSAEVTWRLTGGHAGNIIAASVCPSAALIATIGSDDGCVVVWDAAGRTVRAARSYPMASPPVDVSLHPSGHWLAVAVTRAGAEQLALTGDHLVSDVTFVRGGVEVGAIEYGKRGGLIAIGAAGVTVVASLFAGPSGGVGALARLEGHAGTARRFEWLRHDTQLLSASDDGSMFLYDLRDIPDITSAGSPLHKAHLTRPALEAARRSASLMPHRSFTLPGDPRSSVPSMRALGGGSSLPEVVLPMVLSREEEAERPPGGSAYRGMSWLAPTPLAQGTILALRARADIPMDPDRAVSRKSSRSRRRHRGGGGQVQRSKRGIAAGDHARRSAKGRRTTSRERRPSVGSTGSADSGLSAGSNGSQSDRAVSREKGASREGGSSRSGKASTKWRYPKPGGGGGGQQRGDNRERRQRGRGRQQSRQAPRRAGSPPSSSSFSRQSSRSHRKLASRGSSPVDDALEPMVPDASDPDMDEVDETPWSRPGTGGSDAVPRPPRPATRVSATTHPWEIVSWWGGRVADELEAAAVPVREPLASFSAIRLAPAEWSPKDRTAFAKRWVEAYSPPPPPSTSGNGGMGFADGVEQPSPGGEQSPGLAELAGDRATEAEAGAFRNDMAVWCGTEDGRLGLLPSATGVDVDENSVAAMLENDRERSGGRWIGVHAGSVAHLVAHVEGGWLASAGWTDTVVAVLVCPWLVGRNSGNSHFLPVLLPALVDEKQLSLSSAQRPGTPKSPATNRKAALLWRRWHYAVGVLLRDGLVSARRAGSSSMSMLHDVSSRKSGGAGAGATATGTTDGELGDAAVILEGVRPGDPVFGGPQVPMQLVPRAAWQAVGKKLEEEVERCQRLEQEQQAALRDLRSTLEKGHRVEEAQWEARLEQQQRERAQEREEAQRRVGRLESDLSRVERRHRETMQKMQEESRAALEAARKEKEDAEQRAIDAELDLRIQVEELQEKRKVSEEHILTRFKEAMQEEKRKQEELRQYLHFVREEYESEADRSTERNDHEVIRLRETAAAAETTAQQSRVDARVRVASLQTEVERLQANCQRMHEDRDVAERTSAEGAAQIKVLEERLRELKHSTGKYVANSALHMAEVTEERKRLGAELMNRSRMIMMRELESMQASKAPAEALVVELREKVRLKDGELLEWKNRDRPETAMPTDRRCPSSAEYTGLLLSF